MDDSNALVPQDPQRHFEKMDSFDLVSKKLLESELDNKKLRSLLNRMCTWIADTRKQEQGFLGEATVLLNLEQPVTVEPDIEATTEPE